MFVSGAAMWRWPDLPTPTFWLLVGTGIMLFTFLMGVAFLMAAIAEATSDDEPEPLAAPTVEDTPPELSEDPQPFNPEEPDGTPPRCPGCGEATDAINAYCVDCEAEMECDVCSMPLDTEPDPDADRQLCSWCGGLEA